MSDYETSQRRRNILVGVFVVVALCALVWLVFKFGDLPLFVSEWKAYEVKVQFPTAPGVQKNTPVRFCGYQIGRVTKVEPPRDMKEVGTDKSYHQTVVVLSIDKDHNDIPKDVEVKLMMRGLGSSSIEFAIRPPDPNQPPKGVLAHGDRLQGSIGQTSEFFPEETQEKFNDVMDKLSILAGHANDIIGDPDSKQKFKEILANVHEASGRAKLALKKYDKLADDGNKFLNDPNSPIQRTLAAAEKTLNDADKRVVELGKPIEELGEALAELRKILTKINEGDGTAAKFINDAKFYENLVENTEVRKEMFRNLSSFIKDVNDKGRMPIALRK